MIFSDVSCRTEIAERDGPPVDTGRCRGPDVSRIGVWVSGIALNDDAEASTRPVPLTKACADHAANPDTVTVTEPMPVTLAVLVIPS